ncbi:Proton extrusion protein PcxA [Hyella patelloides LEGE 07179]|uniref:Proton extrusion protein PxcA n=1 Tax=Hyella patelloides LEGE 07179 TaxID=945734 RepID=A0A563VKQ7_9CYAN|nr:proton extrusion protein PcxA [Hyella patelloides]VEP12029.1 Proton extrusion protein PcxA [Hyella patelloides LEGE 07179]
MRLNNLVSKGRKWLSSTPERALDAAYRAAVKIKAIEDDHFQGQKISAGTVAYSPSVVKVFRDDVNNYLNTIKVRLAEFKISRGLIIFSNNRSTTEITVVTYQEDIIKQKQLSAIDKLNYIDSVILKYEKELPQEEIPLTNTGQINPVTKVAPKKQKKNLLIKPQPTNNTPTTATISNKTGVLPRSFMRTLNRIRQEIDPQAENTEEEVIKKFRRSRNKTVISIYFLLILIIVPLFTHQVTKTFIINPLVEKYFNNHEQVIFINQDLEEEALMELHRYEENLHFKSLVGFAPPISNEEVEEKLHHKAEEIAENYRHQGVNGVSNVFADFCSLFAFAAIIFLCKREIAIIKSFLDEIVYGLSDSAKAFLIILLTDMFVGYHSPHGWEVILEGISRHLGLPENHDFNFLFIATFPVILDTVLKYWIFRYLNRISPSSVATYKNMNE